MSEHDVPRPALDAALERRLTDLVNDYGTAQYRLGSRDTKGAARRGDIEAYGRARLALLDALLAAAAERDKLARQIAIACDDAADDLAFIAGYVDTCFDQRPADEWPSWLDMDVVRRRAQAGLERLGDRKRAAVVAAAGEGAGDGA